MNIRSFNSCLDVLDANPPSFQECGEREDAFLGIGRFLEESIRPGEAHDLEKQPNAVWKVIQARLDRALRHMEAYASEPDVLQVWQWYNSGVIIYSPDVFLGLDIVPMLRSYGWPEPEGLTQRLANLIDLLLITHPHQDHYDRKLVRACLDLGKPVCMPQPLTDEWEENANLHAVDDGWSLELNDMKIKGRQACHVWRDNLEDVPSVYYEIECREGFRFIFSGDADYTKRFKKTEGKAIDLLFLPWRNPSALYEDGEPEQIGTSIDAVQIALERIQPARVLLEHYAELEHVYDGFPASYDIALNLKQSLDVPLEWMFWGESLEIG